MFVFILFLVCLGFFIWLVVVGLLLFCFFWGGWVFVVVVFLFCFVLFFVVVFLLLLGFFFGGAGGGGGVVFKGERETQKINQLTLLRKKLDIRREYIRGFAIR